MTAIRQSFSVGGLSEGTGLFEKAIYENKIIHGNNSVLNWMPRLCTYSISCTEVRTDGRDNYLPIAKGGTLSYSVRRATDVAEPNLIDVETLSVLMALFQVSWHYILV